MNVIDIITNAYNGYARYVWYEITHPAWHNYFYWLIGLSLVVWVLEIYLPWRKNQPVIRKDFWLDAWYMFFNFFVFSLIGYAAFSDVVVHFVRQGAASLLGIQEFEIFDVRSWPALAQLFTLFIVRDFVQWNIHRLLHASPKLWEYHKVHHSVEQMGFAAHLRYHWMETMVYRAIEYLPLALFGFGLSDFFVVHIFALAVGHLNHSNLNIPLGPLKYILNNPQMHIWHHAKNLPAGVKSVNYGITLSIWDYLFGSAYIPSNGRDIALGFDDVEKYPSGFFSQMMKPFQKRSS